MLEPDERLASPRHVWSPKMDEMGRENDHSRFARPGSQSTAVGGATSKAPRLLDRMREEIRIRHCSVSTETTYVQWARRFILFHDKRHPKEMGAAEVSAFLTALATRGHMAASTQNRR
jgi:hypothetical protein